MNEQIMEAAAFEIAKTLFNRDVARDNQSMIIDANDVSPIFYNYYRNALASLKKENEYFVNKNTNAAKFENPYSVNNDGLHPKLPIAAMNHEENNPFR